MAIDLGNHLQQLLGEYLMTLAEAARSLTHPPHISTLVRWTRRQGVRLESVVIGGRRYTSREALQRFIAATTAAADAGRDSRVPDPRGPKSGQSRNGRPNSPGTEQKLNQIFGNRRTRS